MRVTFAEHIESGAGHLSLALLGATQRGHLLDLCRQFPFDISSDFGFESRLSTPEAACDFFLLIRKSTEGARLIAGESAVSTLSESLQAQPVWQRLAVLIGRWNDPGSSLHRLIHSFWLEFDYGLDGYNPVPNLFFQLEEDPTGSGGFWRLKTTLDRVYRILFGQVFPRDLAAAVRRCVEALPPDAILFQTGLMIPRPDEAVRLVISRLKPHDLPGFLKAAGWPGEPPVPSDTYLSQFLYAFFDLTIGKEILPSLGTELLFRFGQQPQWDPAWNQVLGMLESDGLLLNEKRDALVGFCGKKSITRIFPTTYYNGINHLKIVTGPGKQPSWKGYFGTMIHRPD